MLVTILGPDGTGKTTLAKELANNLDGFEYVYFGYNKENRSYKYFENFIKSDLSNYFSRTIRKLLIFFNDLQNYNVAKKKNIISDRCPIDKLIGSKIRGSRLRYLYGLLTAIFPHPDYVFLLEGDIDVIYKRKEEIPHRSIELTIKYYKDFLKEKKIENSIIDTTKNNVDETLKIALKLMNTKFI